MCATLRISEKIEILSGEKANISWTQYISNVTVRKTACKRKLCYTGYLCGSGKAAISESENPSNTITTPSAAVEEEK